MAQLEGVTIHVLCHSFAMTAAEFGFVADDHRIAWSFRAGEHGTERTCCRLALVAKVSALMEATADGRAQGGVVKLQA